MSLKKWLAGLCLVSSLGCATVNINTKDDGYKNSLYVSAGPQHYSIEKSEREGQEDIKRLIFNSPVEEAWIYYEKDGKNVWQECGEGEEREKVRCAVNISDFEGADKVVSYHFHPYDEHSPISETFSEMDLVNYLMLAYAAYKNGFNGRFEEKIMTPSGIYTLNIDHEVAEKFDWNDLKKLLEDKLYLLMQDRTKIVICSKLKEFCSEYEDMEFREIAKKFAQKMSIPGVLEINFEPYN